MSRKKNKLKPKKVSGRALEGVKQNSSALNPSPTNKSHQILKLALSTILIGITTSVSQIRNIVSPEVDFSNNQIGTMSFTAFIDTDFEYAEATMPDLIVRLVFPFALTAPLDIRWIQASDTCIVSTNMKKTASVASKISQDSNGAHFFTMTGANYQKNAKYKIIVTITKTSDIPTTLGMTNPVNMSIVSSTTADYITYAVNSNLAKFYITGAGNNDFEFDLTPSYEDPNIAVFTRDFFGQADVRIYSQTIARILIKVNNGYVFSDDAESTCTTMPDDTRNIQIIDSNDYFCEFESLEKTGLYFVFKDKKYAPNHRTFRLKFRIRNPNLPGSSDMKIAMMERYSPRVLKFKQINSAYVCGAAPFGVSYPKFYLGPNLDVSSFLFPNLTLYTMGKSTNAVVFNSARFTFKISIDLPQPSDSYKITLKIKGSAKTVIPECFIYHNLPVASGKKNVFFTIDPQTHITFTNVGSLSSRSIYTIGFKIGLYGDETTTSMFSAAEPFGTIEIFDNGGQSVIKKTPPPELLPSFKTAIKVNTWPFSSGHNFPTMLHTKLQSETANADFSNTKIFWNNKLWGMEKGEHLQFTYKAAIARGSFSPANKQSYVEIITHKGIYANSVAVNWADANAATNCRLRSGDGSDITAANINACLSEKKNQGVFGSEYTRFRMSGKTNTFWTANANSYYSWVWQGANVTLQNSLATEDADASVLDAYINIYEDTYTQDITVNFVQGLKFSYLDNMIVKNRTQFTSTTLHFLNYFRGASTSLDGSKLPGLLRIGGLFNNINTFDSNRVVLFFHDFEPLFKDLDNKYEVGCSTSVSADVKCFYRKGLKTANCNAALQCNNYLMRSRLEVLISSTILSVSNIQKVQIIIPIVIPGGADTTYDISIGSAKSHFGTLSAYPQLLSWTEITLQKPATSFPTNLATLEFNAGNINGAANYYVIASHTSGAPTLGATYDDNLEFKCTTTTSVCKLDPGDYWGITYCGNWDFMVNPGFNVKNQRDDGHEKCTFRLQYMYLEGGNKVSKYCLFCPLFSQETRMAFQLFTVPSSLGRNWPTTTYAGLTGRATYYGLRSICQQSLITGAEKFFTNSISNLDITPNELPYDDTAGSTKGKNLKLFFQFTLTNPVPNGGFLVVSTPSTRLPFVFKEARTQTDISLPGGTAWLVTTPYCQIGNAFTSKACTVTVLHQKAFEIQLPTGMTKGLVRLYVWGVESLKEAVDVEVRSYIPGTRGTDGSRPSGTLVDVSGSPKNVKWKQWTDPVTSSNEVNILSIKNLKLKETNQAYRTELTVDFELGNNKRFYQNDKLVIDLGTAAYTTTSTNPMKRVYCEVLDTTTRKLITSFKTCDTTSLSAIRITASKDTDYPKFTVKLSSFQSPATAPTKATAELQYIDDAAYKIQQVKSGSEAAWPTLVTGVALNTVTVTKVVNYIGFRTQISLSIVTTSTAISYESRLYVKFPFEYGPMLGSSPVSCYLNKGTNNHEKLYCWMTGERELVISGFRTAYAAGAGFNVDIYGVESPAIATNEVFFVGVDSDDDPTVLVETGINNAVLVAGAVGTMPLLEIVRSEYSHNYIRAKNNLLVQFKTPVVFSAGWYIYVYVDYLQYEYDNLGESSKCSIKETETSPNLAEPTCYREGNRFKIKVVTAMAVNKKFAVLIHDIPTPDFTLCDVKKPDVFVTDAALALQALSTDFFQNTGLLNYVKDNEKIYLDFVGLTSTSPVELIKGVYNEVKVKREDNQRLNDDFVFKLLDTENNIFGQLDSNKMVLYYSLFGLANYPIYLSSSLNKFTNTIPVKVGHEARFQSKLFANFPLLRVSLTNKKASLVVPSGIKVYGTRGALPVYVELSSIPLAEITFSVSFQKAGGSSDCSASPSSFKLSETSRRVLLTIGKATDVSAAETHSLVITPTSPSSVGYGVTLQNIQVNPSSSAAGTATSVSFTVSNTQHYGFEVDISSPFPLAFYSISIPSNLYRSFSKANLVTKYNTNALSDQFYHVGYSAAHAANTFSLKVMSTQLSANVKYKTLVYWRTLDGMEGSQLLEYTTRDSAGGFGYLNLTFASPVEDSKKADLVCKVAQLLSYPLEK